jgi:outer membrane protein assembly factor BamB
MYNASGEILFLPAVGRDGTTYIISKPFYTLHAINPDGTLKWKYDVEYEVTDYREKDGIIYLYAIDPQWISYLIAVDSKGDVKWRYKISHEPTYSTYIISTINNEGIIYITKRVFIDEIYAINPDGTLRWKIYMNINHLLSSVYIDENGTLYVNAGSDDVYVYGPDGEFLDFLREEIVPRTRNYTGAELEELVTRAKRNAFERGAEAVGKEDFYKSLRSFRINIEEREEQRRYYEDLARKYTDEASFLKDYSEEERKRR